MARQKFIRSSPYKPAKPSKHKVCGLFVVHRKREHQLLHLVYALHDHVVPENGEESNDQMALSLLEIAIGMLEEDNGWSRLADCLEALKRAEATA